MIHTPFQPRRFRFFPLAANLRSCRVRFRDLSQRLKPAATVFLQILKNQWHDALAHFDDSTVCVVLRHQGHLGIVRCFFFPCRRKSRKLSLNCCHVNTQVVSPR